MPALLSLPRELRDMIIDLVLTTPDPPPEYCIEEGVRRTAFNSPRTKKIWGRIFLPPSISCSGRTLIQTCHQLRSEGLQRGRAVRFDTPFILDVLFVNNILMWPTWLALPLYQEQRIKELEIRIRSVGYYTKGTTASTRSGFEPVVDSEIGVSNPPLFSAFSFMIAYFLRLGPEAITAPKLPLVSHHVYLRSAGAGLPHSVSRLIITAGAYSPPARQPHYHFPLLPLYFFRVHALSLLASSGPAASAEDIVDWLEHWVVSSRQDMVAVGSYRFTSEEWLGWHVVWSSGRKVEGWHGRNFVWGYERETKGIWRRFSVTFPVPFW